MKRKEVIDHIVKWLKDYCEESKNQGFVVGISGGIDSALTANLCALTGKTTLLVNLPIKQNLNEVDRALELSSLLKKKFSNVELQSLNLSPVFEAIEKNFPKEIQDQLTMANTRSRLRMTALYSFAGHHKLLVAGTGNKIEDFGIGFFTKYGDGGVDISPIADLMKSEVFALAETLTVPASILNAAPTDGLFPDGRSDEDQIGASYDELEWAMNFNPTLQDEDDLTLRQKNVLKIFRERNKTNQHKMIPIPVCTIPKSLREN